MLDETFDYSIDKMKFVSSKKQNKFTTVCIHYKYLEEFRNISEIEYAIFIKNIKKYVYYIRVQTAI